MRRRVTRDPSVCRLCGRTYFNLYAHIEECQGKTVRPVEPSPEALQAWRDHLAKGPNR